MAPLDRHSASGAAQLPRTPSDRRINRALAPAWATELIGDPTEEIDGRVRISRSARFQLVRVSLPGVSSLDGPEMERAVADAYRDLLRPLGEDGPWRPLRIWNFVPGILDPAGDDMDRYMRFNAGRYQAFVESFGGAPSFDAYLPAASAVGCDRAEFTVHMLAGRGPATAVTNPRQRAPHRYSRRYGPKPPCFARAVRFEHPGRGPALAIGGTASVLDEDSLHRDDLAAQIDETARNLTALVAAAFDLSEPDRALHHLRALRVYYVRAQDLTEIQRRVTAWFADRIDIEWTQADLCRRELLVEVEGLARLSKT